MFSRIRLPGAASRCGGRAPGRWCGARRSPSCRGTAGEAAFPGRSPGPLLRSSVSGALDDHEVGADARDDDRPTGAAVARATLELAGEKRDPRGARRAGSRASAARAALGARVRSLRSAPLRWSWRSLAYSAVNGSCHTSVTPASSSASAPRAISAIASMRGARRAVRRAAGESLLAEQAIRRGDVLVEQDLDSASTLLTWQHRRRIGTPELRTLRVAPSFAEPTRSRPSDPGPA